VLFILPHRCAESSLVVLVHCTPQSHTRVHRECPKSCSRSFFLLSRRRYHHRHPPRLRSHFRIWSLRRHIPSGKVGTRSRVGFEPSSRGKCVIVADINLMRIVISERVLAGQANPAHPRRSRRRFIQGDCLSSNWHLQRRHLMPCYPPATEVILSPCPRPRAYDHKPSAVFGTFSFPS
jgi:hypothetical protein